MMVCCPATGIPDVIMPDVFGDGMVLQRQMDIPVWGMAAPGEEVSVSINGRSAKVLAGPDGKWRVDIDSMEAGGPYEMSVVGRNRLTFRNVMVGDVWLCSGQSNMWWPMKFLKDIPETDKPVDNPDIRLYSVWSPEHDNFGKTPEWQSCTTDNLAEFSAVGYYFGRTIQRETDVTVGLIHSSMGGSVPESWMRRETLMSEPDFRPIVGYWDSLMTEYPTAKKEFAQYLKELALSKTGSGPEPSSSILTFLPKPLRFYMLYPQGIFDAQLKPLIPYAIKGVVWYQGESSISRAWQYRKLFPAMVKEWRSLWDQGNFPFLFDQLANYRSAGTTSSVPELREAQLMSLSMPNTGMAVTVDIGDSTNVHANNKWDVGRRLALSALHVAYGRKGPYSGPLYTSMAIEGSEIAVSFCCVENGLVARDGHSLEGFEIAGGNRVFHRANARIEDKKVIVASPAVETPVAVRYAWKANPTCNLYNSAGLPASPFRTDDWYGVTYGRFSP